MNHVNIKQRSYRQELFPGADAMHPVLARIFAARQIEKIEQTEYSLKSLLPPVGLKGLSEAVALLQQAIIDKQRILVVGDFDVDGATSTVVAVEVLTAMGATHVDYLVPDRFKYGYGLTPTIVNVAAERNPQLIVTVDNGIASLEGVAAAHEHGIKVLITDHHLPGETLPDADAIVNPNQPGDGFASKALAGVGVIFYVMMALRAKLRDDLWFQQQAIPEPNLSDWIDLVALGTVADMVPLDYNNRIMVASGLERMRSRKCHPGILSILELANRQPNQLTASDLGFAVAPRINAAGRLDDMSVGIECLRSKDAANAGALAAKLDALNVERRKIQSDMQEQAATAVKDIDTDQANLPQGICLFDERWHQGVVGLIASRLKEQLNRPAIAFARDDESSLKGSARSVSGINIRDVLDFVATTNPGLLIKFGGHAMAAGLSIHKDRFEEFSKAFAAEINRLGHDGNESETVLTDGELDGTDLSLDTAELLRKAGPWGQGFPEPLFEGTFNVLDRRVVGGSHLKLVLENAGHDRLDAIAFNAVSEKQNIEFSSMHATYRLDINDFRGQRKPQLIINTFQAE